MAQVSEGTLYQPPMIIGIDGTSESVNSLLLTMDDSDGWHEGVRELSTNHQWL